MLLFSLNNAIRYFAELIMAHYHWKLFHAGPQLLTAVVRKRFWPLRVRNLARRVATVHFECIADLTTNVFLAASKRFVARSGKPELIQCDNALNFQGAQRELEELSRLFRSQQHRDQVTHSFKTPTR